MRFFTDLLHFKDVAIYSVHGSIMCSKRCSNKCSPVSNVVVEWLTLLLRIREVASSNLGPETGYP
jgi:hypothetical protein